LQDSVKMRLMSDVPVGTFFSGGIDSSIIAWFLKENHNITHYTARKEVKDLKKEGTTSDFEYAQLLAKQWKLNLVPIDISAGEANTELISKTLFYSDDLIADGSQIPSYLITREARKTSTVILSGMGADELFCGYKGHIMALLAQRLENLPGFINHPVGRLFRNFNPGKGSFKAYKRHLKQFGRYTTGYGKSRYALFSIVGDYENALSLFRQPENDSMQIFNEYFDNDQDVFDNLFRFELDNFLVKNLHYVDRMCMANSMEGRVPFLDKRIADFAYSIPRKYKISDTLTTKVILKDTFKDILPIDLIKRRKAGFGMPLRSILTSEERAYSLLDLEFFDGLNIVSVDSIKELVSNHALGKEDNSALLYALISFREWHRLWME
jgi:asparagine synthase (glutamine-hydrolysing)